MNELVQVLPGFLDRRSIVALEALADACEWEPGRQGTGYQKASIKHMLAGVFIGHAIRRALDAIRAPMLTVWDGHWDAYLLRYPDGSHIPPHRDEAGVFGLRHRRLNAVVRAPSSGGVFVAGGQACELAPGDAALFYPDEVEHSVSAVAGERVVLSVGAWVRPQ